MGRQGVVAVVVRADADLRFVLVLGALIAIGPLTIDTYLPALPAITRDLAASESAVQGTLTGILLGMGLGQLLVGPLADAIGQVQRQELAQREEAQVRAALRNPVALRAVRLVAEGLASAIIAIARAKMPCLRATPSSVRVWGRSRR